MDVKPKAGRLKVDSVRILCQPGWPQNVVDIDTYGSPWRHWLAMLPRVSRPMSVFLTVGLGMLGTSSEERAALGLADLPVPTEMMRRLHYRACEACLAVALDTCNVIEVREVTTTARTRYYGVRLEPRSVG